MTDMFSPGGTLRTAREKLKLSQHDIAEATRIKLPMVDAIENNDFSRIAAPFYGKGFIKLYAERVGLDPAPLIRDYLVRHAQAVRPSLITESVSARPVPAMPAAARDRLGPVRSPVQPSVSAGEWFAMVRESATRVARDVDVAVRQTVRSVAASWASRGELGQGVMRDPRRAREYGRSAELPVGRYVAIGVAIVVVAILVGFSVHLLVRRPASATPRLSEEVVPAPPKPSTGAAAPRLRLAEEPPAPYLKPRKP